MVTRNRFGLIGSVLMIPAVLGACASTQEPRPAAEVIKARQEQSQARATGCYDQYGEPITRNSFDARYSDPRYGGNPACRRYPLIVQGQSRRPPSRAYVVQPAPRLALPQIPIQVPPNIGLLRR